MTIATDTSSATLDGNGAATEFPIDFVVWEASQLRVYITDSTGSTTPETDWTASLTDDGGSITYPVEGSDPLPVGSSITILRDMPFTQGVALSLGVAFDPNVVEKALDMQTASLQQLKEEIARAPKVYPGQADPNALITQISDAVASTAADAGTATAQAELAFTARAGVQTAQGLAEAAQAAAEAARDAIPAAGDLLTTDDIGTGPTQIPNNAAIAALDARVVKNERASRILMHALCGGA